MDEADLAAVGGELLCPSCQAAASRAARKQDPITASGLTPAPPRPTQPAAAHTVATPHLARRILDDAVAWSRGRWWWARLPLLVFFAYMLARHLGDQDYRGLFGGINLAIHEWGHFVFRPFGEFLCVAGGTILQCLAPIIAMAVFWRQRDYFAILLCLGWLGINFFEVATYMADARARELPLVAPGVGAVEPGDDTVGHDWNFLLGRLGLLVHDRQLAACTRVLATGTMLLFLIPGGFLVWRMWRTRNERPDGPAAGEI